jgi:hypothetical protein
MVVVRVMDDTPHHMATLNWCLLVALEILGLWIMCWGIGDIVEHFTQ